MQKSARVQTSGGDLWSSECIVLAAKQYYCAMRLSTERATPDLHMLLLPVYCTVVRSLTFAHEAYLKHCLASGADGSAHA